MSCYLLFYDTERIKHGGQSLAFGPTFQSNILFSQLQKTIDIIGCRDWEHLNCQESIINKLIQYLVTDDHELLLLTLNITYIVSDRSCSSLLKSLASHLRVFIRLQGTNNTIQLHWFWNNGGQSVSADAWDVRSSSVWWTGCWQRRSKVFFIWIWSLTNQSSIFSVKTLQTMQTMWLGHAGCSWVEWLIWQVTTPRMLHARHREASISSSGSYQQIGSCKSWALKLSEIKLFS